MRPYWHFAKKLASQTSMTLVFQLIILPVPRVAWHRKLRSRSLEFGTGLEGIPDGPSEYATECTRKGSQTSKRT